MKVRSVFVFLFSTVLLCGPAVAGSGPKGDGEAVYAIQKRLFDRYHEISLVAGLIPDEDFYNVFPVGLSYTFNFNENLAWEVVRAQWAFTAEKDLKRDLEKDFGATPSQFDEMKYLVHTNLVVKPSYGKDALWNRKVIHHETFLLAGLGVVGYERRYAYGDSTTENVLSLSFGLGRKYFLNPKFCLNFEFRDLVNFKDDGVENNVYLGVGLGYRFDLSPRRPPRDPAVEELKGYLKSGEGRRD